MALVMVASGVLGAACMVEPMPEGDVIEADQEENVAEAEQGLTTECRYCGNGDYCEGNYLKTGTKVCSGSVCWCTWKLKQICGPLGCHVSPCGEADYCN